MGIGTLLNRRKTTAYYWRLRQKAFCIGSNALPDSGKPGSLTERQK